MAVNDTTVGEAELRHGVAILPAGKRPNALTTAIEGPLGVDHVHEHAAPDESIERPSSSVMNTLYGSDW